MLSHFLESVRYYYPRLKVRVETENKGCTISPTYEIHEMYLCFYIRFSIVVSLSFTHTTERWVGKKLLNCLASVNAIIMNNML